MLSEADRALRAETITSTDIVRIVGASRYGGPCDVFAEKMAPADESPRKLAFRLGHHAEPMICDLIAEHYGVAFAETPTVRHPRLSWVASTPDRLVVGDDGVGEAKYVGFRSAAEWEDDECPPDHVVIQCTWHMVATVRRVAYAGALLGTEFKPYRIEYDEELAGLLLEAGERFYRDHMVTKRPPPVDGSEGSARMLRALFPKARGPMMKAGPNAEEAARAYFAWKKQAEELERKIEGAKQALIASVGSAEGLTGDGWRLLYRERAERQVSYTTKAYRHFDMRSAGR